MDCKEYTPVRVYNAVAEERRPEEMSVVEVLLAIDRTLGKVCEDDRNVLEVVREAVMFEGRI